MRTTLFSRRVLTTRSIKKARVRHRAIVECLEDRIAPAAFTVTSLGDAGPGTLRQAIIDSLGNSEPDTITFDAALAGQTITLTTSNVDTTYGLSAFIIANDEITIDAGDAPMLTISGGNTLRPFLVTNTGTLTLQNVTLSNGVARGGNGGGGDAGGGGGAGLGGAVFVAGGELTVVQSTLSGNQAIGGNGGANSMSYNGGGGGGMTGSGGAGTSGSAGAGGGSQGGSAPSGNGSSGGGGGGGNNTSTFGGVGGFGGGGGGGAGYSGVALNGTGGQGGFGGGGGGGGYSVGVGGTGGFGGGNGGSNAGGGGGGAGMGGAIFNMGGNVTITNSTLTANSVTGGSGSSGGDAGEGLGGAVFSRNGTVTMLNSTVSNNQATSDANNVYMLGDGSSQLALATINNSILGQSGTPTRTDFVALGINGGAASSTGLNNLIRLQFGFGGSIASAADPLLGPLADNGGATLTLLPAINSPVIDAGNDLIASSLTVDQRGQSRILGNAIDIGAVECVPKLNPTVGVVSSQSPSVFGQSVTFTATVGGAQGTPSGTVDFLVNSILVAANVALVDGQASYQTDALGLGTSTVTVTYSGDETYKTGIGTLGGGQVVAPATTTTTVTSSVNPSSFGESVTFTATVAPVAPAAGTPIGVVMMTIGFFPVALPLVDGQVSFTMSNLPPGTNPVTAVFLGHSNYLSSSGALSGGQVVEKIDATVGVVSSQSPSVFGQSVTFTATVGGAQGTPSGTVDFLVNSILVAANVALVDGQASYQTDALGLGTSTVTVNYSGNTIYEPTSGTLGGGQVVVQASTTTTVTSSLNPSSFGESVTFTAMVAPVGTTPEQPGGLVEFFSDGESLGTASIHAGMASLSVATLQVGGRSISAAYLGDSNFMGSGSSPIIQGVNAATPSTYLEMPTTGIVGQALVATFSMTVPGSDVVPTGMVEVWVDGVAQDVVMLDESGAGSITLVFEEARTYEVSFRYLGDGNVAAKDLGTIDVAIGQDQTTTGLTVSTTLAVVGQAVTLVATVSPSELGAVSPGGMVTFFDGETSLGSAPLIDGVATLTVTNLPFGNRSLRASFDGSENFGASESGEVALRVTVILGDYDGDGVADLATYEYVPELGVGQFSVLLSGGGTLSTLMGGPGAVAVVGDFDGDGKSDFAVFESGSDRGIWIIEFSRSGERTEIAFGAGGGMDVPVPADYDGDGITDIATFRANSDQVAGAAQWFILPSDGASAYSVLFGGGGGMDAPVPADYTGDGKADIATFRANSDQVAGAAQWFILPSDGASAYSVLFGAGGGMDAPVPGDYDGDGKADIATFRASGNGERAEWFILPSDGASAMRVQLGASGSGTVAAPGNYAGPGRSDLATFDRLLSRWRMRSLLDPEVTQQTFGGSRPGVVPVLATLSDRLDSAGWGEDDTEPDLIDEVLAEYVDRWHSTLR